MDMVIIRAGEAMPFGLPERAVQGEPGSERDREVRIEVFHHFDLKLLERAERDREVRIEDAVDDVRSAAFVGGLGQEQGSADFGHQRRLGTRFGKGHADLLGFARHERGGRGQPDDYKRDIGSWQISWQEILGIDCKSTKVFGTAAFPASGVSLFARWMRIGRLILSPCKLFFHCMLASRKYLLPRDTGNRGEPRSPQTEFVSLDCMNPVFIRGTCCCGQI